MGDYPRGEKGQIRLNPTRSPLRDEKRARRGGLQARRGAACVPAVAEQGRPMKAVIKLNVGGTVFTTTLSTLQAGSCFFRSLLSGDYNDVDLDGAVFIDRDARYFHVVLQYLRCAIVEVEPPLSLEGALAEAQFFLVDGLVAELEKRICERERPSTTPWRSAETLLSGIYLYSGGSEDEKEAIEMIFDSGDNEHGRLTHSVGRRAVDQLEALRVIPRPLPQLWRDQSAATSLLARFMQTYISRGTFTCHGNVLALRLGGRSTVGSAASAHSAIGLVLPNGDLLLLEEAVSLQEEQTMLEQLARLQSGIRAAIQRPNDGWKRFKRHVANAQG
eukprot:6212473-Pleurochrysis_carterae.AAC.1